MNLEKVAPWNWFKKEEPNTEYQPTEVSPYQSMLNMHQ